MSMLDAFRVALRAILGSRLRSALTALGLIIGVSSVIATDVIASLPVGLDPAARPAE